MEGLVTLFTGFWLILNSFGIVVVCSFVRRLIYCNGNVLGRSNPAAVSFPRKGVSRYV